MRTNTVATMALAVAAVALTACGGEGRSEPADTTAPTVASSQPLPDATDVALDATVTATFSEGMDAASIDVGSFVLSDGSKNVPGQVTYAAGTLTATFTPTDALVPGTLYTASVAATVKDAAGVAMAGSHAWSFTTVPDTTAPSVTSTSPAADATGVGVTAAITVTFSERLEAGSVDETTFRVAGGSPVAGVVTYEASTRTATFTPTDPLAYDTFYTVTLGAGMTDLAGNPLAGAPFTFSFATRSPPPPEGWTATSTAVVENATSHTAVWTGSLMIIWGGKAGGMYNRGTCYDPVADAWTMTDRTGAPEGRWDHTAVWTGTRMIIFGGWGVSGRFSDGGSYDPVTDSWTLFSAGGKRSSHSAVWTGTEMIVWGGNDGTNRLATGIRYNPTTGAVAPTATTGAPSAREGHVAVWTGTEMIVWGGQDATGSLHGGARYDPATDTWTPMIDTLVPGNRYDATAVWTGEEMLVWGGSNTGGFPTQGGRYSPATNTWTWMSATGAPGGRVRHSAVWTGTKMIIWGGTSSANSYENTGWKYDPVANTWSATTMTGAPTGRQYHSAVWTGDAMIVFGGTFTGTIDTDSGAKYYP